MPPASLTKSAQPARLAALVAIAVAALGVSAQTSSVSGQTRSQTARQPERAPAARSSLGVALQSVPTRIDALDLTFFLPEDAVAETTSFGVNATMGVELPDGLGVLVIKGQRSTNPDLTVELVTDSMIEQLYLSRGKQDQASGRFQTSATLIDRTTLRLAGLSGERFYIRVPGADGSPEVFRGVTVFRTEPGRFLVFDLMTEATNFETARRTYETVVGTIEVADRDALAARRAAAIDNLQSVLATLTPDELRLLAEKNPERWERLYTPARSGDEMDATEHGYRRVRVRPGVRGEVSGTPERNWTAADRASGLIVQLDAMALESRLRVDTRAVYFVSDDFKQEAWTVNMALRQEGVTTESSVSGARSGTSMTIQLKQDKAAPTVTRPVIQGEGYVSQALTYLIAPMLVSRAKAGEFAAYAYNPATNIISLRWDTVEQPADKPGLWVVRSRADDNTPATTHTFNGQGRLMRSELHNGRIWEPIELDRLVNLWKRKGMPLE